MGKDDLKWVANTTTLIYGEQEALLVDTFLSDAHARAIILFYIGRDAHIVGPALGEDRLAGGIDHSTGKAALRHEPDERVVWSLIGKCDSIRLTRRVQLAQRARNPPAPSVHTN
jgi:hypothetical protein